LQQHFTYRLVLELDQVPLLSGDLVEQLSQLHGRIEEHGGLMRLCGLSPRNRQVLESHCPDDCFMLCLDRQEAVMGSERPRQPR
jgi:anti-anti-sigma regulatory factor